MSDAVEEGVCKAVEAQIELLRANGAIINEVSLPHTKYVVPTYYIIASSEASANLERYDGIRYGYRAEAKNLDEV
ncbi:amidase family protein, partial [Faecalibacterium prausnitzii]|uniref:amidase family protein n=1 Tax=Faecalibacterium prausnitzii TaxID=853 RepID=UPI0021092197